MHGLIFPQKWPYFVLFLLNLGIEGPYSIFDDEYVGIFDFVVKIDSQIEFYLLVGDYA